MSAEQSAGKAGERLRSTWVDMLRSILPIVVIILIAVWLYTPSSPDPVREVDPADDFAYAVSLADFPILIPTGLPDGWRPTRSQVQPAGQDGQVGVSVGYVTPAEEFAQYVDSSVSPAELLDTVLGKGYRDAGSTQIGGVSWQLKETARGEAAVVRTESGATVVITGSAARAELDELARSLQPAS